MPTNRKIKKRKKVNKANVVKTGEKVQTGENVIAVTTEEKVKNDHLLEIDYMYLTNPIYKNKSNSFEKNYELYSGMDDVDLFKKRAITDFEDLLNSKWINSAVNAAFNDFIKEYKEYRDFKYKTDEIQKEFAYLKDKRVIPAEMVERDVSTNAVMNKEDIRWCEKSVNQIQKTVTIDKMLNLKTIYRNKNKKPFLPKQGTIL